MDTSCRTWPIDDQLNGHLRKDVLQSDPPNRKDRDIASLLATTLPVAPDPPDEEEAQYQLE
ncbi:MAG: hypothetical protein M1305_06845 [Candidatus Marsarchaeota archaeon]|nr:hypothetical protein [Candidatus Marsarchaeota archaeon]